VPSQQAFECGAKIQTLTKEAFEALAKKSGGGEVMNTLLGIHYRFSFCVFVFGTGKLDFAAFEEWLVGAAAAKDNKFDPEQFAWKMR
jgi:hypothetical protein